jgi:excisionase family DNA binding protein
MSTAGLEQKAPPLITVVRAAKALGVGKTKLYSLMDEGELPYVKLGRCRRIDPADLEELVRRCRVPVRLGGGRSILSHS